MAFDLTATLEIWFDGYEFSGIGSESGIQIVPYSALDEATVYKIYPTNYFGVREQHDLSGNDYYEWQWFVPSGFMISYKVWSDPVVGGPDGNTGRTRLVVVNTPPGGGSWRTLFLHDEYLPWVDELVVESPAGAVGTAYVGATEEFGFWIPNPPQTKDRPIDYDPDLGWDEPNRAWTPTARGGGRYRQQFVAIGKEGEIYYGDA